MLHTLDRPTAQKLLAIADQLDVTLLKRLWDAYEAWIKHSPRDKPLRYEWERARLALLQKINSDR